MPMMTELINLKGIFALLLFHGLTFAWILIFQCGNKPNSKEKQQNDSKQPKIIASQQPIANQQPQGQQPPAAAANKPNESSTKTVPEDGEYENITCEADADGNENLNQNSKPIAAVK